MRENYTLKRLYNNVALSKGAFIALPKDQVHYLATVLRMQEGDELRLFNNETGEWLGRVTCLSKRSAEVEIIEQLRLPFAVPDVRLAFAPVRKHRTAFIFEKATELGVAQFEPILTARTQFPKLNLEKVQTQIIEAAEQTERLDIPAVRAPQKLLDWLSTQTNRHIVFADEAGEALSVKDVLEKESRDDVQVPTTLLIGPEGGFTALERDSLRALKNVTPVSLGPRILRADTAALSLLTLWQSHLGDWNEGSAA